MPDEMVDEEEDYRTSKMQSIGGPSSDSQSSRDTSHSNGTEKKLPKWLKLSK